MQADEEAYGHTGCETYIQTDRKASRRTSGTQAGRQTHNRHAGRQAAGQTYTHKQ